MQYSLRNNGISRIQVSKRGVKIVQKQGNRLHQPVGAGIDLAVEDGASQGDLIGVIKLVADGNAACYGGNGHRVISQ